MTRINTAKWIESAGRWQINVTKDGVRKTFVSNKQGRKGQLEANKKADEWLDGELVAAKCTVEDAYKEWLKKVKETTTEYNYCDRVKHGKVWILPAIGKKKLQNITEQDLQDILDAAYTKGRAEKTIKNIRGSLTVFLNWCRRKRLANINAKVLTVNKNAPVGKRNILSEEDLKKLFKTPAKNYWYLNAYRFIALTGLREGELINLRKEDVANGVCRVVKGKSPNAPREFLVTRKIQDVLDNQLAQINRLDTDYVFPSKDGNQTSRNTLYKQWKAFQKQNGFANSISVYELRHTFVSYMKDVPLEYLKMQVGHSKTMDTFGVYGHKTQSDMIAWEKILSDKLNEIIGE